ncbi:MAG: CxxxxCH/CxxCH domain c-type cytochrome, partial [Planctomycetota bacterium]
MSKKLLILFIAAAIIGFTFSPARAVDFPHNEQSMIGCDSCHDVFGGAEDLMLTFVTYGTDIDDTQSNSVCWSCHNDVEAPLRRTHSSLQIDNSYGDWSVQCKTCHWPHDQQNLSFAPDSYRTSGISTDISGLVLTDDGQSWGINDFQGMLLITNLNQETSEGNLFMYRILSNTDKTITVAPPPLPLPQIIDLTKASIGDPYAVIYGKLVRDLVDTSEIIGQGTPQTEKRVVKFFINAGANSFADGDTTFDGICEVCHVETQSPGAVARFRYNEHLDTHNESTDCTVCHVHLDGMSPSGACNICHGFPPIEDVPNSSSTGGENGLVDNPGSTGSVTAGQHNFHVNTLNYNDCHFCHYNSVGSGSTHVQSLVVTLGFSLFSGAQQGGDYDGQVAVIYDSTVTSPPTNVSSGGTLTCDNLYCHSNVQGQADGTGSPTVYGQPEWNDATSVLCGSCHNDETTVADADHTGVLMDSGTHTRHVGGGTNYTFGCVKCHDGKGSGSATHVNNDINWAFDGWSPSGSYSQSPNTPGGGYGDCSSVYCHSDGKSTPNYVTSVTWGTTISDCVSCHGGPGGAAGGAGTTPLTIPHTVHTNTGGFAYTCTDCHNTVASDNTTLIDLTLHVNNARDINVSTANGGDGGDWSGTNCSTTNCHGTTSPNWAASGSLGDCSLCHGMAASKTDGRDTAGNTANTDPQVGAHVAHLDSTRNYSLDIQCDECHTEPSGAGYGDQVNAAGHNDDALPAEVPLNGTLANAENGTPSYSGAPGGTCSTTYCHDGTLFLRGYSTNAQIEYETPDWNTPIMNGNSTDCDNCHGYPPAGAHPSPANDCKTCHNHINATHDGFEPQGTPGFELHVNGILDVQADCNSCHGYPPTPGDGFGYQAVEGKGAHQTHVDHIEALYIADGGSALSPTTDVFGTGAPGAICGTCHTKDSGEHQTGDRIINFGSNTPPRLSVGIDLQFGATSPNYNGIVGTPG